MDFPLNEQIEKQAIQESNYQDVSMILILGVKVSYCMSALMSLRAIGKKPSLNRISALSKKKELVQCHIS